MPVDLWNLLLVLGLLALAGATVMMVTGRTGRRAAAARREAPVRAHVVTPTRASAARAAHERAAAAARAKAAAAARARSHELTDVRELPAGQPAGAADGHGETSARAVSAEDAEAIIAHYAQTDPHRLAEVIIQWIRTDGRQPGASSAAQPAEGSPSA